MSRMPLEEAEALVLLALGKASGKVVLVPRLGSTRNPDGVWRRGASHAI